MFYKVFFSHSIDCSFTLLIVFLATEKFLSLVESHLSIFAFAAYTFGSKKSLQDPVLWNFSSVLF